MSSSPSSFAEPKLPQLVPILTGKFYSIAVSTLGILTFLSSSRADTDCVLYLRTLSLDLSSIYLYSLRSHYSTEIKAKDRAKSDNPIFWGESLGLRRPEEADEEYMEPRKDLQSIRYTAVQFCTAIQAS
ncbi:hypothetical protein PENPOL_c003G03476 [Penicillium polonicum]|uniref:Uncharacterized protein n=1 Tax=Penicillium polonicum TaxID=60169 RepID=A0A1V6NU23_PENPO|nr:hypothetical protein PENPOL_c003G03476 [Penicillium polonicum]